MSREAPPSVDEDRLRELADSINAQGMVQPIVVRPVQPGFDLVREELEKHY